MPDGHWVNVWGAGTAGRPASTPPPRSARCPRMPLGDGWPSRVRAVDAPALQDVPAWEGKLWPGSLCRFTLPEPSSLTAERLFRRFLRSMQRDVDLIANVPIQSADNLLEIHRVLAALSEVRPLAGSLH